MTRSGIMPRLGDGRRAGQDSVKNEDAAQRAGGMRPSLVGRTGDVLTLVGFAMAPSYGKGVGGINGFPYADMVLGLAAMVRALQFMTEGIPKAGLRRQAFLLSLMSLFCLSAVVSGFANNDPVSYGLLSITISTVGSVLLVASYGDGERSTRPLVQAFAIGCTVLAASAFIEPARAQGRAFGWAIHPNQLGHSCLMGAFAAFWLYDQARSRTQRLAWLGSGIACVAGLMESGSRGGLLGLWAGGMIYLCLRGRFRVVLAAVAVTWGGSVLLVTGVIHLPPSNPIVRLVSEGTEDSGSNAARRDLLSEDVAKINNDPMFGAGLQDLWNIHVVYYQGWIGAGAFGGLVLMGLGLTMVLVPLWQRPTDLALACGLAAIALAWLFTNILTPRDQWLFIAVAMGSTRLTLGPPRADSHPALGGERRSLRGAPSGR